MTPSDAPRGRSRGRAPEETGSAVPQIASSGEPVALSIKNEEADALARELADLTGESLTQAVVVSLRERLVRQRAAAGDLSLADRLMKIGQRCAALPLLDAREPAEILGYDEHGLPT